MSMHLTVEPVAGLGSSALQSTWIQRLKTNDEIPLQNLELGNGGVEATTSKQAIQALSKEILCRLNTRVETGDCWNSDTSPKLQIHGAAAAAASIHHRSPRPFGSFLMKLSTVKFRKPPLPPSSSLKGGGGYHHGAETGKAYKKRWRVHGVDAKLEKQHRDGRRALLAEFASRLEIKEKPTPLGTFHIVERKNRPSPSPSPSPLSKEKKVAVLPCLTPVVVVPGAVSEQESMTASLAPEMMDLETPRNDEKFCAGRSSSMEANQSQVSTMPTIFCGSSPCSFAATPRESNQLNVECGLLDQEQEDYLLSAGKRRLEEASPVVSRASPNLVKRGRYSGQGVQLAGTWLSRWNTQNTVDSDKASSSTKMWGMNRASDIPSAAAIAIVGAAVRELESHAAREVANKK